MNGLAPFKQQSISHRLTLPLTSSAPTPIISMGPETEAALTKAGLPNTLHTDLHKLVTTKVNTAWVPALQAIPFSLSVVTAAALCAAVLHDIENMV